MTFLLYPKNAKTVEGGLDKKPQLVRKQAEAIWV